MVRLLAPGAHVVLSGLLTAHANAALAAYRVHGLVLKRRVVLDGWATLVPTVRDGVAGVRFIEAVVESSRSGGAWVKAGV